jgi:hypothetical protein
MSEDAVPERAAVVWSPQARAELRAVDRKIAMQILDCLDAMEITAVRHRREAYR